MDQITFTAVPALPLIHPGDDLARIVFDRMTAAGIAFQDGDVLVVAQKVVSKCEGRLVHLRDVQPTPRALGFAAGTPHHPPPDELILPGSKAILKGRQGLLL